MILHSHNIYLVVASLAVALMAGFTGLSITRGASMVSYGLRKTLVAMSAIVLGSGIWAMHFIAMLGMQLPLPFYYDTLTTLISALVAILLTGIALLMVHFGERTPIRITLAGLVLAIGILAMHYIGMSGIQIYDPVYTFAGVAIPVIIALVLCVVSFWLCYGQRSDKNIVYGTLGFGIAVFTTHFVAMAGTDFHTVFRAAQGELSMSNGVLAIGVALTSFMLSGAFLLTSVTFKARISTSLPKVKAPEELALPDPETCIKGPSDQIRIPFEQAGEMRFIPAAEIAAIRSDGRYTYLYHTSGRLFSPCSISKAERELMEKGFVRCHRSYLVNLSFVEHFERKKDTGICHLKGMPTPEAVPVSRSYLAQVRKLLGL